MKLFGLLLAAAFATLPVFLNPLLVLLKLIGLEDLLHFLFLVILDLAELGTTIFRRRTGVTEEILPFLLAGFQNFFHLRLLVVGEAQFGRQLFHLLFDRHAAALAFAFAFVFGIGCANDGAASHQAAEHKRRD